MENELTLAAQEPQHPLTANAVVARVRLIQEVMQKVMKKDTHYGVIPGTPKPTLYKPGAEQLLVTFRIAPDEPKVEDLSTADSIRYRVTRTGRANGMAVAAGVGECSSDEEKYKWRRPVCDAEFDAAPEDRKRLKFKRDGSTEKQIRTNPADVANTILKMADKRAFVAMTLLATAASDIFTQDLEDLSAEVAQSVEGAERPTIKEPEAKAETPKPQAVTGVLVAAVKQLKKGTNNKGEWTMWKIVFSDGIEAITFDDGNAAVADRARIEKKPVSREVKKTEKGYDLTGLDFTEQA